MARCYNHRSAAEPARSEVFELEQDLGRARLTVALRSIDLIREVWTRDNQSAPGSLDEQIARADRIHVIGALANAADRLAQLREDERALSSVTRSVADAEGGSTLVISRRARELQALLASRRVEELWLACRAKARLGSANDGNRDLIAAAVSRNPAACSELTKLAFIVAAWLPDPRSKPRGKELALFEYLSLACRLVGLPSRAYRSSAGDREDTSSRAVRAFYRLPGLLDVETADPDGRATSDNSRPFDPTYVSGLMHEEVADGREGENTFWPAPLWWHELSISVLRKQRTIPDPVPQRRGVRAARNRV